ncbi:pyranose oxidase [Serendipita vermifera MAFF 305830]|uniref:Pyranose 2-oxidase n=1 Tax=Serendipita vermifera MAFF 305830 TaxID=933852 RepID=A0A0C2XP37_SERVB|nr:pyranose oxidase [Serendipita vermifera MAFF 305830]
MAEIGAQNDPIVGAHHKNNVKYQRDIDQFVNVIKGALQPISVPPADSYMSTLAPAAWSGPHGSKLLIPGYNPNQVPETNLRSSAVTRTVGGMATHWTCSSPKPHEEERVLNPIPAAELDQLLDRAADLLKVKTDQYDTSIRHRLVKKTLQDALGPDRGVDSLPLGVTRNTGNPEFVTWTATDTIFDKWSSDPRFTLLTESRVTELHADPSNTEAIGGALIRDLKSTNDDIYVKAKVYIVACGAVCTPQLLWNSNIRPDALGRYLTEQSLSFCQIVLTKKLVESIYNNPEFKEQVDEHLRKHPNDPLPIPYKDPEPQVLIPYKSATPWHVQVHRDAFSYGDVGPKADPRVVVDLRFFGKGEIVKENRVTFGENDAQDIYGMPQATFYVTRTADDADRDQRMMQDMTTVANVLGGFLPGSYPQFMEPGLALHITGTTRIGNDPATSVADANSRVHGFQNLFVGGNGCIPDATACNPTRTSMAIALKGAAAVLEVLKSKKA